MPATATTQRTPMTTTAITTQIHAFTLPAIRAPQDRPCVLDTCRIVATFAKRLRLPRFVLRAGAIAALQRQAAQFDARAAVDPWLWVGANREREICCRLLRAPEQRACGASLVPPQRLFAGHLWTLIPGQHRQALGQQLVGLLSTSRAERTRPCLEPEEPIPRKQPAEPF